MFAAYFLLVFSLAYSSILKMEAVYSFETSVEFYRTNWRHILGILEAFLISVVWTYREIGIRLEPPRGSKAWPSQKDLEEDGRGRSHGSGEGMERG
jgi:hypothetical protein